MRQLSSAWTFYFKFLFPTVWIGGFALVTLQIFIAPNSLGPGASVHKIRWLFAGFTVIGGAYIYWACVTLKKVVLSAVTLLVSNYRHCVEVPLHDVEGVSASVLISPQLIWVRLRRSTPLGTTVAFMPKIRWSLHFSRHPLVGELRALISRQDTQG